MNEKFSLIKQVEIKINKIAIIKRKKGQCETIIAPLVGSELLQPRCG